MKILLRKALLWLPLCVQLFNPRATMADATTCTQPSGNCFIPEVGWYIQQAAGVKPGWPEFCPASLPIIKHYLNLHIQSDRRVTNHVGSANYPGTNWLRTCGSVNISDGPYYDDEEGSLTATEDVVISKSTELVTIHTFSGSDNYTHREADYRTNTDNNCDTTLKTTTNVTYSANATTLATSGLQGRWTGTAIGGCSDCGYFRAADYSHPANVGWYPSTATTNSVNDLIGGIPVYGPYVTLCNSTAQNLNNNLPVAQGAESSALSLSVEYTDGDLEGKVRTRMLAAAWQGVQFGTAMRWWSESYEELYLRRALAQFTFGTTAGVTYLLSWKEITITENGGYGETFGSKSIPGTGGTLILDLVIEPPDENGIRLITDYQVCPLSQAVASAGCATCGSGGMAASLAGPGVNAREGFSTTMGLGATGFGRSAGSLRLLASAAAARLTTPKALAAYALDPGTELITDSSGAIRQVNATQTLADVVTNNAGQFTVTFYSPPTAPKSGGLYPISGLSVLAAWTVRAPNWSTGDYSHLQLVETRGGVARTNDFQYDAPSGAWTYTAPGGLQVERTWNGWSGTNKIWSIALAVDNTTVDGVVGLSTLTRYHEVINPVGGAVLLHEESVQSIGDYLNYRPAASRSGTMASPPSTTYGYGHSDSMVWIVQPTGEWHTYDYDGDQHRHLYTEYWGVKDLALPDPSYPFPDTSKCRMRIVRYDSVDTANDDLSVLPDLARKETEYLLDNPVSQIKRVVHKDATTGTLAWVKEYRMNALDALLSDTANLVTTTSYYTTTTSGGAMLGFVQSVVNPDGTGTFYKYVDASGQRTTTRRNGWLNGGGTDVSAGTQTITVVSLDGRLLSSVTTDIASGLTTASDTYSNFDLQGRAQMVVHLGNLTNLFSYACCGLDSSTTPEGITTTYVYDSLKRQIASTTAGVTTTNLYDLSGNLMAVKRIGSDGTAILQAGYTYDDAKRLIYQTNALGVITAYAEAISGGHFVRTTTEAYGTTDAVTHIETYYLDGQLKETSGTGDNPTRYDMGVLDDGGTIVPFNLTIKLTAAGTTTGTNEWTATLSDFFRRTYKTVYSDNTSGTLNDNPYSQSFYDSTTGRLTKSVDPDGLITLYSKPNYTDSITALDLNQDSIINYAGTDRITKTVTDVTTDWTNSVRRTTSYDYTLVTNSTATVTGVIESSVDGLRSWQTTVGVANPTTSVTVYAGGGTRYVTNTAPDGSYSLSVYSNGRLTSVTQKLSIGTQIGQTAYTYDAYGRQWKVTDARNGTTVYSYNNADQVTAVTTPPPGVGQPAQTTTTTYDYLGRVKQITQPDGAVTYSEYYPTGQLKHSWGARTYPVEYVYDAQGRMTSLKTYRVFNGNWTSPGTADTTSWTNDIYRGWLNSKRYADGTGPDYAYYASGRMKTRQWSRGSPRMETVWAYNKLGDISSITYTNDSNLTPDLTFGYDRRGCQTAVTNVAASGTWTVARTFDLQHNPLTEAYSGSHPLSGLTQTIGYDSLLRRSTYALNSSSALSYGYGYDDASRLTNVTDGSFAAAYTYLANSPLAGTVTAKQGSTARLVTTRSYDYLNRLQNVSAQPQVTGSLPLGVTYQYNDANQRTRQMLADGSSWVYAYDSLGQVISGKRYFSDGTPVPGQQFEYGFDTIGNRSSAKHGGDAAGANLRSDSYVANFLNQYSSRTNNGGRYADILGLAASSSSVTVNSSTAWRRGEYFRQELSVSGSTPAWQNVDITTSGGGSVTGKKLYVPPTPEGFTYDTDGNLSIDGRWNYTWDAENRLVKMETTATAYGAGVPRQLLKFDYDDQGRRIRKELSTWTNSAYVVASDTRFVSDGWNVVAELNGLSSNALLRNYLWGSDLSGTYAGAGGVGGLIHMKPNGGNAQFAAYDGNGNVIGLVDGGNAAVSANYEYSPFGETLRLTGTSANTNPFRFSTKFTDVESGLLYYGYRYYNPAIGRWINRDPSEERGGVALYGFVHNNSSGAADFLGLWDLKRKKGQSWAIAEATGLQDTKESLAELVKLNYSEFDKWATKVGCNQYKIPNTVIVYTSKKTTLDSINVVGIVNALRAGAVELGRQAESVGYNVITLEDFSSAPAFKTMWKARGIYGYIFAGHGAHEDGKWYGFVADPYDDSGFGEGTVGPQEVSPPYKLAFVAALTCGSGAPINGGPQNYFWKAHVSDNGYFTGFTTWVDWFNFPWVITH